MAGRLTMKARSADVMLILLATVVAAVALGAMWLVVSVVLRYHDTVQHAGIASWLVALGGPVVCSALAISFVATHRFRPATIALLLGAGINVVLACALTRTYLYPCSVPILACSEQSWDGDHSVSQAQMLLLSGGLFGLLGGVLLLRYRTAAHASAGWPNALLGRRESKEWYLPAMAATVSGVLTLACFLDWHRRNVTGDSYDWNPGLARWAVGVAAVALLLAVGGWRLGLSGRVGAGAGVYTLAAVAALIVIFQFSILSDVAAYAYLTGWLAVLANLAAALRLHWRVAATGVGFVIADVVLVIVLAVLRGGW